ncbi:beta-glucuronosyltransferase GlcAT14A-like [Phalaenopsis equestris]|uniref:beta-glucuronosyltransferase GlcAT14A-like n=1 Tax=Phalaenopsis equestris TaxID=78828 RepID=UPI0009E1BCB9|nr:beta-glucuronosyltransferase GlcAT14A-like [Phalaenopsis equestris]
MLVQNAEAEARKKAMQSSSSHYSLFTFLPKDTRHLYCLLITAVACFLLFLLSFSPSSPSPLRSSSSSAADGLGSSPLPAPPSFAYLLSGSTNDADRLIRLVLASYHPKNLYLLHLDLAAPQEQRDRLARDIHAVPAFRSSRNVHVLGRADFANPRGSSALASTIHGAAVLLRLSGRWDWFVNLGADDYPLVTQDDLLHVFSFLPKDLNFVQHSSYVGWRESRMLKHVIVDPGLYLSSKADVFYATQKRDVPNAYRIFTGSSSVILSRKFVEHIILGTDNLPRALLMYYTNSPSSHKNYLQTVLCNSPEFSRTIVNDHLHYLRSGPPSKQDLNLLLLEDLNNMTLSGAAFGSNFYRDDPVLDQIDKKVLNRGPRMTVPGGWCLDRGNSDPCRVWGNPDALIPGPGATRLARNVVKLLTNESFQSRRCAWD